MSGKKNIYEFNLAPDVVFLIGVFNGKMQFTVFDKTKGSKPAFQYKVDLDYCTQILMLSEKVYESADEVSVSAIHNKWDAMNKKMTPELILTIKRSAQGVFTMDISDASNRYELVWQTKSKIAMGSGPMDESTKSKISFRTFIESMRTVYDKYNQSKDERVPYTPGGGGNNIPQGSSAPPPLSAAPSNFSL